MSKEKKSTFSIKKIKKEYILVIALCVIGAFLVLSSFTGVKNNKTEVKTLSYAQELEDNLTSILSKVKGVGNVSVKISVDGKYNNVIATEKETITNKDGVVTTEKPIYVNGKPVYLKEGYPNVVGVIVVASGADNLSVKANMVDAITTYLKIDSSIIVILKGK